MSATPANSISSGANGGRLNLCPLPVNDKLLQRDEVQRPRFAYESLKKNS